ncbi:MAG: EAL domain-containing protein [Acidimicrobiales bacterium]
MIDRAGLEEEIRRATDPLILMQRVADEAMALVEGIDGAFVGFAKDAPWLTLECGSGTLKGQIGNRVRLDRGLTGLALRTGETLRCDDAESDSRVDLDLCHVFHVVSMLCVPLRRRSETTGMLCVTSSRPRAFDERDVATLASLAEFISVVITVAVDLAQATEALLTGTRGDPALCASVTGGADWTSEQRFVANVLNPGVLERFEIRGRVDRFLRGRGLTHVFQPIFDITSGECFAVEALARFSGRPKRTPDLCFAEAYAMGVGVELELAAVKGALSSLSRLPGNVALCVNASPEAMISDELHQLLAASESRRIVVELTEEAKVNDYSRLSRALNELHLMDVRLGIDDSGAGFSSFSHILRLAPDIIKLDRELTSGIDHDPVRAALGTALVSFAARIGAKIIAEGIETAGELDVLRGLGIRYGQGYFLCRPTSLDSIPSRLPQQVWATVAPRAS